MNNDVVTETVINSLASLPTPYSISFLWNFGFLLGITLTLQVVTGLVLSLNYVASTDLAFDSVIHIMRDIDSGWAIRYAHINGASLFFALMFSHIIRGLYFESPNNVTTAWVSGVLILLASMGAAFLGYVLPWGQMSFWGATVITSIISAIPYIGNEVTMWLWGNFSVSQPTLNRFFSLHFLIPLVIVALVVVHLIILHKSGSNNPTGTNPNYDNINFAPYFLVNDVTPMLVLAIGVVALICINPNLLGDVENFNIASITTTPPHIQPEWYFLFAYAILRSIPSNLGGVVAMVAAILILLAPCVNNSSTNNNFLPTNNSAFWWFLGCAVILTWVGANPVEHPFVVIGQTLTTAYFSLALII